MRPFEALQAAITATNRDVRLERAPGLATEWLVLRAPICAAIELDAALVCARNARLAFATIALANGTYWLRIAVPSDSAELADPVRLVALVVDAAASLVPHTAHAAAAADPYMFDHFTS